MNNSRLQSTKIIDSIRDLIVISPIKNNIASINIVGSGAKYNITRELDIYIIFYKMLPENIDLLKNIFKNILPSDIVHIEFRRGPFKPRGNKGFQFHIIIDDLQSIKNTNLITLCDWWINGKNIYGHAINKIVRFDEYKLIQSFRGETINIASQVINSQILYKDWSTAKKSKVQDKIIYNPNFSEIMELYKHAYKATRHNYEAICKFIEKDPKISYNGYFWLSIAAEMVRGNNSHLLNHMKFKKTVVEFNKYCYDLL